MGDQLGVHLHLQAHLHQAKGRALGQARVAHPLGLPQRLGGQRLERVLAWRHGGAQRRHGRGLSRLHEGGASVVSRAPSGCRHT
jgi:hypothetical protein